VRSRNLSHLAEDAHHHVGGQPQRHLIVSGHLGIGCFYVFGSRGYLHGATPSERTFIGVIPTFTSANLAIRMLRSASSKRRLPKGAPKAKATNQG
jgi:hypothetical protein